MRVNRSHNLENPCPAGRQYWFGMRSWRRDSTHSTSQEWGKWRRGWDSNPRSPQRLNGFRDRPDRPLRHLSVGRLIVGVSGGCKGESPSVGLGVARGAVGWLRDGGKRGPRGFAEACTGWAWPVVRCGAVPAEGPKVPHGA